MTSACVLNAVRRRRGEVLRMKAVMELTKSREKGDEIQLARLRIIVKINEILDQEGLKNARWFTFENKIVLKVEDQ